MKLFKSRKFLTAFIIAVNVLFVGGLAFGEWSYIRSSRNATIEANKEVFETANDSLSSMTNNYLLGESHLCRSWASYLNKNPVTMNEARDFAKQSIIDSDVIAHVINKETHVGVATKPHKNDDTDYSVSYSEDLIKKVFTSQNEGVKTSAEFTEPITLESSIAFYTEIKLKDDVDPGVTYDGYLMRIIPSRNLEAKWTFPSGFEHLEVAVIDNASEENLGAYVFHHKSFKSTSFFNYYRSYSDPRPSSAELDAFKQEITTGSGTFTMKDYLGHEYFFAYSQIANQEKWTIITVIPLEDITNVSIDWLTISIIGVGLGVLFIFDLVILLLLNKNLQETTKMAESANQAKTEFLSTMSHDIRTPMNAIIGLTNIASRDSRNPDSTQDALKKISLASNHLLTLINDILDISKVESGKLTLNPISFCIVDTFENLVNISQPMVRSKNIDFSFRTHDFKYEWLYADKLRLSQIFTNLLSNALKYTEEKGRVSVDIKELPSEIEGCTQLVFQVEDTGIGMSKEFLEKMYTPFSRATDSRVNSIQGTGLGLSITKQMVDLMGGTIECESEVGKGTKFVVTIDLPIDEKPNIELALPPIKVLIVDDDEILLKTAEETLKSLGAETFIATSGKQALEMIKEHEKDQFKVVILDWKMPDMNGLEVSKKIKEIDNGNIPIILISAYDWSEIEKEAADAGINGFIFKPLFRSKIYQKIIELLNNGETPATVEENELHFDGTNILVVEDNDINYEIISTLLDMYGITTERAENGKVALETIQARGKDEPFDLIFMDIQMPVMNGLDATRAIRKLDFEYAKKVPIIAMTADAFSENVVECLKAGMNAHIAKPIDINVVLTEIKKIKNNQ